ncbi:hypothetical protein QR680_001897 [Steinernema hermaphroditum]|uniref:Uncharacterized protein n=1 Tax=Steinernema hermaphroditum TaxID=289476 RepID=A0AA39H181_9BILA|nr:hypothetical protein QR680_001897 [Steinernema hermaphroditum]
MSEFLSTDELAGVGQIRQAFKGRIPALLDTDFNLRRWWNGHGRNLAVITEKFDSYLKNRKVMGFDEPGFMESFYNKQEHRDILQYFGMSKIGPVVNEKDNGIVFVESGEIDKHVTYTYPVGKYLKVFFTCCELVLQTILKQERESGKPSHGICIFDMGPLHISNHINPLSNCNKVFKARALIWEDNYPDMIQHIVVVNSPFFLGVIWKVAKFLLKEKQQKLIHFNRNDSIKEILHEDVIPVAFGGKRMDLEYTERTDCCNEIKRVTPELFYKNGTVWTMLGIDAPTMTSVSIKANSQCKMRCAPKELNGQNIIAWQFSVSDQLEFVILKDDEQVYPCLKMITTECDDEDVLHCSDADDDYNLVFKNHNRFTDADGRWLLLRRCKRLHLCGRGPAPNRRRQPSLPPTSLRAQCRPSLPASSPTQRTPTNNRFDLVGSSTGPAGFFAMGKKCFICKKKCTGDIFKTEAEKYIHIACFQCNKCSRPLTETGFFTSPDGTLLCPDDYRSVSSPLNVVAEQPKVERHEELPSPPLASPTACAACDQPLHTGQVLLALDQSWHVWCFKCAECDAVLQGEYMTHEGKPLCLRDYNVKHGVKCYECDKFIAGKVLQAGIYKFHPTCARCSRCGNHFGDGAEMYMQGDEIWHPDCEHSRVTENLAPSPKNGSLRARPGPKYQTQFGQHLTYMYLLPEAEQTYLKHPIAPHPPQPAQFHTPQAPIKIRKSRLSMLKTGMQRLTEDLERTTPRAKSPHMDNEEPIEMAHYPAGHAPAPDEIPAIERDDFPAPPYPYAVEAPSRHLNRPKPWMAWQGRDKAATTSIPFFHVPASLSEGGRAATLPNGYQYGHNLSMENLDTTISSHYSEHSLSTAPSGTLPAGYAARSSSTAGPRTAQVPAALRSSLPDMSKPVKAYPLIELQTTNKKLPDDVDRQHLERHLNREEFEDLFSMTPIEFYKLPEWKRINLKRKLKLF